ncbi:MAG TPA: plasmid maintenance protein CcdB [Ghiorsea sp.]|nr:plasmid maintenance protein CcdB [Ghiorsea sp.]HIP07063.1 plasmid maintenance protein CcdB [Mariprofundaceae bacterium]
MAQFDVYASKDNNTAYPLLVDVQNELLHTLNTRLVIPLTPLTLIESTMPSTLCPILHLEQGDFVLMTQFMSSMPTTALDTPIASISNFHDDIVRAVDLLITGI